MQRLLIAVLFTRSLGVGLVAAQSDHCFKNDGLKLRQTISFTLTGNKLEGTFDVSGYVGAASAKEFAFTGKREGPVLTIRFKGNVPYTQAPGTHAIRWTLGQNSLRVPMFGKDHNKHRGYISYTMSFGKCKEV